VTTGAHRGLSPARGASLLVAASRAWALLAGRPMVLPEDVQAVFPAIAGSSARRQRARRRPQAKALLRAVPLP
jgi:MoxR-like ATPase